eukprot:4803128-Pleurochrysis_carterae.AAC.1
MDARCVRLAAAKVKQTKRLGCASLTVQMPSPLDEARISGACSPDFADGVHSSPHLQHLLRCVKSAWEMKPASPPGSAHASPRSASQSPSSAPARERSTHKAHTARKG